MTWIIGLLLLAVIFVKELAGNAVVGNVHAIKMVAGGTLAIVFLLSSPSTLKELIHLIISAFRTEKKFPEESFRDIIQNPTTTNVDYYGLVNYSQDLIQLGLGDEEFEQLIYFRAQSIINQHMSAISVLRNLGKYPPALGMIGTVLGMMGLFDGLGTGGSKNIGGQLAVAMTATFYGLILSNLLILPLADRLEAKEEEKKAILEQILKVFITIHQNQPKKIARGVLDVA